MENIELNHLYDLLKNKNMTMRERDNIFSQIDTILSEIRLRDHKIDYSNIQTTKEIIVKNVDDEPFWEFKKIHQKEKDIFRRLFIKDSSELYIWYKKKEIIGFQFCYGSIAVTYSENKFNIHNIDSGKLDELTPILSGYANIDLYSIINLIEKYGQNLDDAIKAYIRNVLFERL